MRSLKSVKKLLLDEQLKINIIELSDAVLVSADVPALRWCYDVNSELSIGHAKMVYTSIEIPEVGKVEVVGCKVIDDLRVINVKYRVTNTETAIHTYYKVINYLNKSCR